MSDEAISAALRLICARRDILGQRRNALNEEDGNLEITERALTRLAGEQEEA